MSTNGEVIHVDDKPSIPDVVGEIEIHKCLECRWGATESKKHHRWFEQPQRHNESSLPLITFFDSNVVIPPLYVEFGKEGKLAKVVDKVGDKRQGVCVLDCMFVKITIVLDWPKFSILLFDKEKRGGLQGLRWSNPSCFHVFVDKCLAGGKFLRV